MADQQIKWMKQAMALAQEGWGRTKPNPLVGCVIVKDDHLIAEGFHAALGKNHAERSALSQAIQRNAALEGATLYVNLEPCVHQGRTPPCVDLIIESGIKSVVIAMTDPNPLMSGKGIEKLRKAGIDVATGVLEAEAQKLNEIFVKYITTGLPFVLLKTAMSLDGKIATNSGDSRWISGEQSRALVHHWRKRVSGILVGQNTVLIDNPSLTARCKDEDHINPTRIIVDSSGHLPFESKVFADSQLTDIILATTSCLDQKRKARFMAAGTKVVCLENEQGRVDLPALIAYLGQQGLDSIMLEGGGRLNEAFLQAGLIDKIMLFMAPKIIGGCHAVSCFYGDGIEKLSDAIRISEPTVTACGEDWLIEGYPIYGE